NGADHWNAILILGLRLKSDSPLRIQRPDFKERIRRYVDLIAEQIRANPDSNGKFAVAVRDNVFDGRLPTRKHQIVSVPDLRHASTYFGFLILGMQQDLRNERDRGAAFGDPVAQGPKDAPPEQSGVTARPDP